MNPATVAEKRPVCVWGRVSESDQISSPSHGRSAEAYEYKYAVCVSLPAFRLFLIELFRPGKIHGKQRIGRVAIIGALWGFQFVTVGGRIHATIILVRGEGGSTSSRSFALFPLASGRRYGTVQRCCCAIAIWTCNCAPRALPLAKWQKTALRQRWSNLISSVYD